jgi:hypothetical protein
MRLLVAVPALLLACAGCATSTDYPRRPTAQEIADVEGVYGLSDGFRAHLFGEDSQLYVRIGAGPQKQLTAMGPGHFASTNDDVSIQFLSERAEDGAERIMVEYVRRPGARAPLIFSTGPRPGRGFVD